MIYGGMMKGIFALVVTLVISGCATNMANKSPEYIAGKVEMKNSEFDSAATFLGPVHSTSKQRGLFSDSEYVRLRAFEDKKTGKLQHQIYVVISYVGGWRYYDSVSFVGGETVGATAVDRKVNFCQASGLCSHNEDVIINLSREQLIEAQDTGFKFRINSRQGINSELAIPPSYVRGFMIALESNT